jgi:hypothetical protein
MVEMTEETREERYGEERREEGRLRAQWENVLVVGEEERMGRLM